MVLNRRVCRFQANKQKVVDMLIGFVTEVDIKVTKAAA
jgi:hypothetical protein